MYKKEIKLGKKKSKAPWKEVKVILKEKTDFKEE